MIDDLELSELISVKLCHDLSGPVGAVNNGTELLKDANEDIYQKSLELIEGSAKDAIARILLYRQAYGSVNSSSQVNLKSLKGLTENYYASSNVDIKWPNEFSDENQPIHVNTVFAKTVLNAIMVAAKTMIYGGAIEVETQISHNKSLCTVKGKGRSIRISEEQLDVIQNKDSKVTIDIKNVHLYLLRRLAEKINMNIKILAEEDLIEIKIA